MKFELGPVYMTPFSCGIQWSVKLGIEMSGAFKTNNILNTALHYTRYRLGVSISVIRSKLILSRNNGHNLSL